MSREFQSFHWDSFKLFDKILNEIKEIFKENNADSIKLTDEYKVSFKGRTCDEEHSVRNVVEIRFVDGWLLTLVVGDMDYYYPYNCEDSNEIITIYHIVYNHFYS
jgi:hypothetical protein